MTDQPPSMAKEPYQPYDPQTSAARRNGWQKNLRTAESNRAPKTAAPWNGIK